MAKRWIQKIGLRKGALHRALGIPEDKPIPTSRLLEELRRLKRIKEQRGRLTDRERRLLRMILLALRLRAMKRR